MAYPYEIDTTLNNVGSYNGAARLGPFLYGTARYVVLPLRGTGAANDDLRCYKSTDLGLTWAVQDTAAAPTRDASGSNRNNCFTTQVGSILYVSFIQRVSTVSSVAIARFDCATDTWLSTLTGGPTITAEFGANSAGVNATAIVARSNGDLVVAYVTQESSNGAVKAVVYSGGSFGAPIALFTAAATIDYGLDGMVLLPNNDVWCFGTSANPSTSPQTMSIVLKVLDASNGVSPGIGNYPVTSNIGQGISGYGYSWISTPIVFGSEVIVPFHRYDSGNSIPYVLRCPTSNPASWTEQQIASGSTYYLPSSNSSGWVYIGIVAQTASSIVAAWWDSASRKLYRSTYSGASWGTPELLWDDPGLNGWGVSILLLGSDRYGIVTGAHGFDGAWYLEYDSVGEIKTRAYIS